MKSLREYIDLIELLLEGSWWPSLKPGAKPRQAVKGPELVVQMPGPAKEVKPVAMVHGYSDAMTQLHKMQANPQQFDLGAVDHLATGLLKTLPAFEADANVKKNLETILKNIINASEGGEEQLVRQHIAKLYAQFEALMKTGQYDVPAK